MPQQQQEFKFTNMVYIQILFLTLDNDVTAVSLHPGAVHTEIFKGPALLKRMLYLLYPIFAIFIKTPLEGNSFKC